jgi:UDP-N-acetylmuramate dehydrogenase
MSSSATLLRGFENVVRTAQPLADYTWFKLGGPAEYLAEPQSIEQLAALVVRCRDEDVPIRVLGGGSNLLVREEGVPGMVVRLTASAFDAIVVEPPRVRAGGGAKLGHVISESVRAGLAGLEVLVGIPGTVGGALHGNAGSHGGDIGQWTSRATVITRSGEIHQRERPDLEFAYRQSPLDELVILSGEFELEEDDPEQLTKRMQKLWIIKKANQPMSHQSAGCIFKNPRGMSAGELIEHAGFKGIQVGGAEVSQQHANFMIAHPGTTSQDVMELIELVRSGVAERLGVELEMEIEVW